METKQLKFYDFSLEKLIELKVKSGTNTIQFLSQKENGDYEVMYLNYENKIISFHMTDCGEYLTEEDYPKKFALL